MNYDKGIIYAKVLKSQIADITRIMEGYEHLALVSTMNANDGIIKLLGTPDTVGDILLILANLPFDVEILENFHECE
ncbi:MAG: DUF4911 domain-containing protein [Acidaminococcaceae bacterium]